MNCYFYLTNYALSHETFITTLNLMKYNFKQKDIRTFFAENAFH